MRPYNVFPTQLALSEAACRTLLIVIYVSVFTCVCM